MVATPTRGASMRTLVSRWVAVSGCGCVDTLDTAGALQLTILRCLPVFDMLDTTCAPGVTCDRGAGAG